MTLISKNVNFLFEMVNEKTNRKRIDFCRESSMMPASVSQWVHNGVPPSKRSIVTIVNYFNEQLKLNITPDMFISKDLGKNINKYFRISHDFTNLSNSEKECLSEYWRLSPRGKETILRLLKDFE